MRRRIRIGLHQALTGESGLQGHLNKISRFEPDQDFYSDLEEVLHQMRLLKLIDLPFGTEKRVKINPSEKEIIFALGNYHNRSAVLCRAVDAMTEPENYQLRFATSSFVGYGLYCDGMMALPQFRNMLHAINGDSVGCAENSQ